MKIILLIDQQKQESKKPTKTVISSSWGFDLDLINHWFLFCYRYIFSVLVIILNRALCFSNAFNESRLFDKSINLYR